MPWVLLAALIRFTVRIENKNAEWKDLKKKKKGQSGQKKNMLKVVNKEGNVWLLKTFA